LFAYFGEHGKAAGMTMRDPAGPERESILRCDGMKGVGKAWETLLTPARDVFTASTRFQAASFNDADRGQSPYPTSLIH
jgi:hypothetical protein